MLSGEMMLALGIVGFYLFDCLKLSHPDQYYFVYKFGNWNFYIPNDKFHIGANRLHFLNPFTPLSFLISAQILIYTNQTKAHYKIDFLSAINDVRAWLIFFIISLISLIITIITSGINGIFLMLFFLTYIFLSMTLWKIWTVRVVLNLSKSQAINLALECLLCAPFAVNLIRKISLLQPVVINSPEFAIENLNEKTLSLWKNELLSYVLERKSWYEPGQEMHNRWSSAERSIVESA